MKTIALIRDAEAFPDSHHATVDEADREAWIEAGWEPADPLDHDGDGKKGGSVAPEVDELRSKIAALGHTFHHKAGVEKLMEQLNALLDEPHEDADGLSHRELNADLEAAGLPIDPTATAAEKFALLSDATKAEA